MSHSTACIMSQGDGCICDEGLRRRLDTNEMAVLKLKTQLATAEKALADAQTQQSLTEERVLAVSKTLAERTAALAEERENSARLAGAIQKLVEAGRGLYGGTMMSDDMWEELQGVRLAWTQTIDAIRALAPHPKEPETAPVVRVEG